MRIEAAQQVTARPEAVFARLADFAMLEERARRRNLPVQRLDDDPPAWRIGVVWGGLSYTVDLRIDTVTRPEGYTATAETRGVEGAAAISIAPNGRGSILSVALDLEGRGVAGRMVLRTLDLARPMLEGRLAAALARLGAEIEAGA